MSRVIVYIDGFNLFFGLRSKGWRKYYWLDFARLAQTLIKPAQQLEELRREDDRRQHRGKAAV